MNPRVSFFQNLRTRGEHRFIGDILQQIRAGKYAGQIARLRAEQDPAKAAKLKKALPAFTASCTTNGGHKLTDARAHSGLLQGDIDKIGGEKAELLREALRKEPCVFAAWISPSGDGLKLLIRVEADLGSHAASFATAKKHFLDCYQIELDSHCKDVSRLCFVSHDPQLWINENAQVLEIADSNLNELPPLNSSTTNTTSKTTTTSTQQTPLESATEKGKIVPPNQRTLYHNLCARRLSDVEPGTRNAWLCELLPLWNSALSETVAMEFAGYFWEEHRHIFTDTKRQHLAEARALYRGTGASYHQTLSAAQRAVFDTLTADQADAFRICQHLSKLNPETPDTFFLSGDELAKRLGAVGMKGTRLLQELVARGVLSIQTKGTRRKPGEAGKATVFRFLLS